MTPRPRKVYLSGPMTGYPQDNFPAFEAAAAALRQRGYDVVSPAEMDSPDELAVLHDQENYGPQYQEFLDRDLALIRDPAVGIEALVLLPGFADSNGARREMAAAMARGLGLLLLEDVLADAVAA